MGLLISDLPKTENAAAASSASTAPSADDVLAQMAGHEIDRLLAEAENGAAPPAADAPAVDVPAETPASQQLEGVGVSAAPAAAAEDLAKVDPPIEAANAPTSAALQVGEAAGSEVAKLQAEVAPAPGATDGLRPSVINENHPARDESDEPLPIYVKFLEALNSPMESLPDAFRAAMGKVAVVTLLNAIGLIVYVTFFRHHRGR